MIDLPAAAIRFALFVSLMGLFGLSAFMRFALTSGERHLTYGIPPKLLLLLLAVCSFVLSALSLLAVSSQMSGTPMDALDLPTLRTVLFETPFGASWIVRIAALGAAFGCLVTARPRWSGVVVSSSAALVSLAWAGHGVMDQGSAGWLHLGTDILHLLAAAGWLGSLAGFLLLLAASGPKPDLLPVTHRALTEFAKTGTFLVATIILSGLINAWFTVGSLHVRALPGTNYGNLLLGKIVLVIAMLALASTNRFCLTPVLGRFLRIGTADEARRSLWISVLAETLLGIAVLAIVAWLGLLEPPSSSM